MDRRRLSRRDRFRNAYWLRVQFCTKVLAAWFTATPRRARSRLTPRARPGPLFAAPPAGRLGRRGRESAVCRLLALRLAVARPADEDVDVVLRNGAGDAGGDGGLGETDVLSSEKRDVLDVGTRLLLFHRSHRPERSHHTRCGQASRTSRPGPRHLARRRTQVPDHRRPAHSSPSGTPTAAPEEVVAGRGFGRNASTCRSSLRRKGR